jgi:hypothetical protein
MSLPDWNFGMLAIGSCLYADIIWSFDYALSLMYLSLFRNDLDLVERCVRRIMLL